MSSVTLVVLAYALVWAVVTGYLVVLTLRVSRLERDIRDLGSKGSHESETRGGDFEQ